MGIDTDRANPLPLIPSSVVEEKPARPSTTTTVRVNI